MRRCSFICINIVSDWVLKRVGRRKDYVSSVATLYPFLQRAAQGLPQTRPLERTRPLRPGRAPEPRPRTGAGIARKTAEGIIGKGNERRDDRTGVGKHCTPATRVQETFSLPYNDAFFEVDSIVQTSKHIHPEQSIVFYGRAIMGDNDYIPITLGMNPKG